MKPTPTKGEVSKTTRTESSAGVLGKVVWLARFSQPTMFNGTLTCGECITHDKAAAEAAAGNASCYYLERRTKDGAVEVIKDERA